MTCIAIGLFIRRSDVDLVVEHLVQELGIPRQRVQVHGFDTDGTEMRSPDDSDLDVSLRDLGLPEDAARDCGTGMCSGRILVAVWADKVHAERILRAYREYGAVSASAYEGTPPAAPQDQEQQIRIRAYHLWEQEGRPTGRDAEFWAQARGAIER